LKPYKYFVVFFLILLCSLIASCSLAPNSPSTPAAVTPVSLPSRTVTTPTVQTATAPLPAATLQTLSAVEQLAKVSVPPRDLRDLTVRLNPQVNDVPLVVNQATPDYAVGDKLNFWVHNVDTVNTISITAELVYKTAVAYVWVETGQSYNLKAIQSSVDRFSQQSYPTEVAFFGSEWRPGVDNDPRLHILHTGKLGGSVAGYYSSADEYSRLANRFSNEKELFYINLQWLNSTSNYSYYETVLAHEFQHMIHWANDRNEATWVNEGLSEYAQEVAGYAADSSFVSTFTQQPDTQLNTWNPEATRNAVHYGSAYLFMHYLTQRFGGPIIHQLVANPANGIEGVKGALAASGQSPDFNALFADWVVANYANQPDALGKKDIYGYQAMKFTPPTINQTVDHYPFAAAQTTVQNYATNYIKLNAAGNITLNFAGQTTTRLTNTNTHSGKYAWWSNRDDDSDSSLTRQFDLTKIAAGAPVTMSVAMWWDIEKSYDYGYVEVSRDGRKWQILPGQHTTTENPSGNSFGAGYTAQSLAADGKTQQWVVEQFDLGPFAGQSIWLRFEYVTDDATNGSGWLIDDVQIPALAYADDFEQDVSGWQSDGWLLTDGQLPQPWLLQVMEFNGDQLTAVRRAPVDATGHAQIQVDGLGNGKSAVVAVSGLAPVTTEPATYQYQIEQH